MVPPDEPSAAELPKDLKLVYEELVRIGQKVETLTQSSFEDFKLLGALAAVLGLSPVAEYFKAKGDGVSDEVKLLTFFVLFAILAVIAFRDLMKQSLIRFLMNEADVCAKILAERIDERASPAFQGAKRWERWARERHGVVARNFSLVVMLPVTILPAIVLRSSPGLAACYVGVVVLVFAGYARTVSLAVAGSSGSSPG